VLFYSAVRSNVQADSRPTLIRFFVEQSFQTPIQHSASLGTIVHDACQISTRVILLTAPTTCVFGGAAKLDIVISDSTVLNKRPDMQMKAPTLQESCWVSDTCCKCIKADVGLITLEHTKCRVVFQNALYNLNINSRISGFHHSCHTCCSSCPSTRWRSQPNVTHRRYGWQWM
jgi:hypothetical protein